jgi:hypothetical protein
VSRLSKSEYAAVLHPEQRIPEASVGQAFNLLMDRMSMPELTRVSADELHAFRVATCLIFYPSWVTREPYGSLPPTVRPLEAAYLVYLLYSDRGISQNIRQAILERGLPRQDPSSAEPPGRFHMVSGQTSREEFQRRKEYWEAKSVHLATHTDSDLMHILQEMSELIGVK